MVALSEKNFLSKMEHSKYDEFNYVPPQINYTITVFTSTLRLELLYKTPSRCKMVFLIQGFFHHPGEVMIIFSFFFFFHRNFELKKKRILTLLV